MQPITLNLTVTNGYEFPKEMDSLAFAIQGMNYRLENTQAATPEDEVIAAAFEQGYEGLDSQEEYYTVTIREFSQDFPNLKFMLEGRASYPNEASSEAVEETWSKCFQGGNKL